MFENDYWQILTNYNIYIYIYIYIYICYKVWSADLSINVKYIYVELNLIQFGYYVISINLHT